MSLRQLKPYGNRRMTDFLHFHPGQIIGIHFRELSADTTVAAAAGWQDLFEIQYDKKIDESFTKFLFTCSASNSNANTAIRFQLLIDGTAHRGCSCRGQGDLAQSAAMIHVEPLSSNPVELAAGLHTNKMQWQVSAGTGRIRPQTHADDEGAEFLIEEIAVP